MDRVPRKERKSDRSLPGTAAIALLSALVMLCGCSTFSGPSSRSGASTGRGGYYLDDGPGTSAPANLDAIPDAVPRPEPLNRATARPYTVMGRTYTPMTELAPYRERGIASWYGRRYHGKPTSSGEPYDMYAMTAAHTTLPIPSYARVTNVGNGRSVVVRINDRGPFLGERLIDVSYVAAHKLDIVRSGSGLVEVEAIVDSSQSVVARAPSEPLSAGGRAVDLGAGSNATAAQDAPPIADPAGHYLQLAAFGARDNAERFVERVHVLFDGSLAPVRIVPAGAVYRVRSGPYPDLPAAQEAARRVEALLGSAPMLMAPR